MLIVIALLLILSVLTIQSFRQYAQVQQFTRSADEVGHLLHLARQQTIASKNDMVYGVYVGTSTVELFSGATPDPGTTTNTILSFGSTETTATSSFSNAAWYVTFSRVTGEASATGTIVVNNDEISRTATYTIYQSGLVQ